MSMISVKDVSLTIGKAKILQNITIEVEKGSICGLIGRNGCGKTMLMKCICGFILPTSGQIYVNEKQIGVDIEFPENTGIMIETPGFIPELTGRKNLSILAGIRHVIGENEIRETMKTVGLDPDSRLSVKKYSLGMRQRLGMAQAIMEKPELLILDEPFNSMDKDGVRDIRQNLIDLKKNGTTILITSHVMEDIDILCDKVYELDKGKLI